jgi:hypothetical protein
MLSTMIGVLVVAAVGGPAAGGDLQNLAGPRGSRWGDSPEKVQRTEGRDNAAGIGELDVCVSFDNIAIDGRKYVITYRCFERGSGLGATAGWRLSRKGITTADMTLQPFVVGPPRAADDEFTWWERELTGKYGVPTTRLDVPQSDDPSIWPRWCPSALENQLSWVSGDCPLQERFTKYRRWIGKKTVIELYDVGGDGPRMRADEHVHVVFAERSYFDAAEKTAARATAAALKKQTAQAASQKRVPAF